MADWEISQLAGCAVPALNVKVPVLNVNDTSTAPADAFGSDQTVTWGQVAGAAASDVRRVFSAGHSYPSGFLGTEGAVRWPARLAAALGAEEVTYAQTSSMLAQDDGGGHPGGYATVLNGILPRATTGAPVTGYVARSSQPYLALSPVSVFDYGLNDLTYLNSNVTTAVAWFKMALRAITCLSRAGGYFPDTHASVAYGGSGGSHWSAQTGQGQFGSPTNHKTTTVNDTVTITVPADFPGGEVDLLSIAFGGASGGGTKWSTVVDGGAAQLLDGTSSAFGSSSGRGNLVVQRLTGLAAGAHTIVATVAALDSTATAIFDSWLIAAPALPVTVLVSQPAFPALPLTTAGLHTPITSTDVAALNTAIAALPAEFTDGGVVAGDIATAFANAGGNVSSTTRGSLYVSDNLHPNTTGHGLIAQVVRDAVRAAPPAGASRFGPVGRVLRQVQANGALPAWPNGGEPALRANWFISGSPATGYFSKGPGNLVEAVLVLIRSSAPSIGEIIFTLPPGYAPEAEKFLTGLSYNGAFTVASPGILSVRSNGDVVWYAGDPTTLLQVSGSYYAGAPGF